MPTRIRARSTSVSASIATTNGKVPLLECVKRAEREITDKAAPRVYLPIDGIPAYDKAVQRCCSAPTAKSSRSGRAVTVQALGGTGGLKVGADFLRKFAPAAQVCISDPSWENHRALFEARGLPGQHVPVLRRRRRTASSSTRCARRSMRCRRARSSCCMRAATTPPASIRHPRNGTRSWRSCARAASYRSSTSPTRASATVSRPMPRSCASSRQRRVRCSCRARSRNRSRSTASASAR